MNSSDCIFCKIISGQIPSIKVYEDEVVLAFLDIGPVSDGHTLVVPKQHVEKLDTCPAELLCEVSKRVGRIAAAVTSAVKCDGYNVLCNNGRAAGQVVDHLHFHIIPRTAADNVFSQWPSFKYPQGKAEQLAQKIRKFL